MIYGYARVSTKGQQRNGNSLEEQERVLKDNGAEKIYVDAFTGTKLDRPEFTKLMNVIGEGDTLIATKLDRVSRSASKGIALIDELLERGVNVHIVNMGRIDNTPTGKLIRNIFLAFAEFERDQIVERTQEGKAVAKANNPNFTEGRPRKQIDRQKLIELQQKRNRKEITLDEACKELGIKRSTWYNVIKEYAV